MITTLRVIVDDIVSPAFGSQRRYSEEVTRELIRTAPVGCQVSGIVSAVSPGALETVTTLLPGLTELHRSALPQRQLQLAWQYGLLRLPGGGMVHAPSLFAPLSPHDRTNSVGQQTVVTLHDVIAWSHPEALSPRQVRWQKTMASRAFRFADAVVVPTHSVAQALGELFAFGERVRVIPGAVSAKLAVPIDAESRAIALDLPEQYLLTTGSLVPHRGLEPLIRSLAADDDSGLPLLVIGSPDAPEKSVAQLLHDTGIPAERVRILGPLADADLAVVLARATVFIVSSVAEGLPLSLLEAFAAGIPVVHSDAASVLEIAADAGVAVRSDDDDTYPERLASAIAGVCGDPQRSARLAVAGRDRARAFSWRDSARQIWQLHADL